MLPLLAETEALGWQVLTSLSSILALGISSVVFIRFASGKGGERQIEPTQLSAVSAQIAGVSRDLGAINRELGEVRAIGERTEDAVSGLTKKQHEDMGGVHRRIDALSDRVSGHDARINGIEKALT